MSRGLFKTRFGFIAAAAGSAVGLGNIWRFPYETGQNGGAIFLLFYIAAIFLICLPILIAEITIGRKTRLNPFGAFKLLGGKAYAVFGFFGLLSGVMILSFYNVVAGWAFGYLLKIVSGELHATTEFGQVFGDYVSNAGSVTTHAAIFMIGTAFIVGAGIQKGIERWTSLLMPILIFMMLGLVAYAVTLPGAIDGLRFYLVPDTSKINLEMILSAISQAFFSLGLGLGLLVTYGSYVSDSQNLVRSATIIAIMDTFIAFLAGLLIFPLVFSQNLTPGAGPGLVFVTLPGVFYSMGPVVGKVIGSLFFLLLCFAALTSTISILESPVIFLQDQFKIKRKWSVAIMATITFIIGIPSLLSQGASEYFTSFVSYGGQSKGFLDLINDVFSEISLPLGGLLIALLVIYKWKFSNMVEEVSKGNSKFRKSLSNNYVHIILKYVAPILMGVLIIIKIFTNFLGKDLF
ncbi:MAG: sodium-dependent transporter [Chitinophagales bacterium]|nr:sodium-dependent transporter [Chitinophagales bacterium]